MPQSTSSTFWRGWNTITASPFFERVSILAPFADEFEFAGHDNWDGRGATAVSKSVLRLAERLIERFGGIAHLVEVAPGRDGSLSFVWDDGRGNYVYVDVGPGDTIHLFYELVGEPKWEGVSVASDRDIMYRLGHALGAIHNARRLGFVFAPSRTSAGYQLCAA